VISAYSPVNYLQPGVSGYLRYELDGIDPSDGLYLASFPEKCGSSPPFPQKDPPAALLGEYRMADVLNSPVHGISSISQRPVRMRLSATVVAVQHEGAPESAKGVVVTFLLGGKAVSGSREVCDSVRPAAREPPYLSRYFSRIPEAMNAFHHAPMLTVNIALRNWKFMDRLGIAAARWFEGFGWWVSLRRNL